MTVYYLAVCHMSLTGDTLFSSCISYVTGDTLFSSCMYASVYNNKSHIINGVLLYICPVVQLCCGHSTNVHLAIQTECVPACVRVCVWSTCGHTCVCVSVSISPSLPSSIPLSLHCQYECLSHCMSIFLYV